MQAKAKVAIVRCFDYSYSNAAKAIKRCIDLFPADTLPRNKKVLLKPNLLSSTKGPDEPVNTHPVIVEALAKYLKDECGCSVYVGDSSGGMSYGQTKHSFEVSGLLDIANRLGIKIVNFENIGTVNLFNPGNKIKKEFPVTKFIKEVDFIISLPKLKTHSLVGFTGAVKNMMGVVPGSGKRDMHVAAPKRWEMESCIVDLYSLVKPHFSLMDAIVSMEGDGPAAGLPVNTGLLLASNDALALDTIASEIVGFTQGDLVFIKDGHERGLGIGDINEIEVLGESVDKVKIHDFKKPRSGITDCIINFIPGKIFKKIIEGMTSGMPFINKGLCCRCNICYDNCPVKAINILEDGSLWIDHALCFECYCCHEFCPYKAIEIKVPFFVLCVRSGIGLLRKIYRILK